MRRVTGRAPRRRQVFARRVSRLGLWIAVPVLILGGVYGAVRLSRSPLGQSLLQSAADRIIEGTGLLGLTVADIRVEGRETTDRETILAALGVGLGTPILAANPTRAKEQLEALPWVRTAVIERRLPDTLYVRLVERKPLALWQHGGKLDLIDREGAVIPVARLDRFAKLPWWSARVLRATQLSFWRCWRANPIWRRVRPLRSALATDAGTCVSIIRSTCCSRRTRRQARGRSSPDWSDRAPS